MGMGRQLPFSQGGASVAVLVLAYVQSKGPKVKGKHCRCPIPMPLGRISHDTLPRWGTFNDYVDTICPFLTATYLYADIFKPERGQK